MGESAHARSGDVRRRSRAGQEPRTDGARAAAVTVAVAMVLVVLRLASFDWNPTGFVWAGDQLVQAGEAPSGLLIREGAGFDGAGFYRLALDPLTREREEFGIFLDHPAFRHQRIVYPAIAWATTGGNPTAVAWALIALNVIGLGAIAWLGALLARAVGRAGAWGLAFAFSPAFFLALGVDTAEIVAGVGFVWGLLLLRSRAWTGATIALTLAMLTRETTLILPAAIVVARLIRRDDELPPWWVPAIPIGGYLAWQAFLGWWWGGFALGKGAGLDLGVPFGGMITRLIEWIPPAAALDALHILFWFAVVAFGVLAARSVARGAGTPVERTGVVLSLILIALTSPAIWFHHWGFLRAVAELYVLGVIVVLSDEHAPRHRLILAPAICASLWINLLLYP